jgi:hypothetical protein
MCPKRRFDSSLLIITKQIKGISGEVPEWSERCYRFGILGGDMLLAEVLSIEVSMLLDEARDGKKIIKHWVLNLLPARGIELGFFCDFQRHNSRNQLHIRFIRVDRQNQSRTSNETKPQSDHTQTRPRLDSRRGAWTNMSSQKLQNIAFVGVSPSPHPHSKAISHDI